MKDEIVLLMKDSGHRMKDFLWMKDSEHRMKD